MYLKGVHSLDSIGSEVVLPSHVVQLNVMVSLQRWLTVSAMLFVTLEPLYVYKVRWLFRRAQSLTVLRLLVNPSVTLLTFCALSRVRLLGRLHLRLGLLRALRPDRVLPARLVAPDFGKLRPRRRAPGLRPPPPILPDAVSPLPDVPLLNEVTRLRCRLRRPR